MERPVKCLNVEFSAFNVSESVVLSTSSSSLSPCAILVVDAIMSSKEGWSIQETFSVFSSSRSSNRDALAALFVLAGTILKNPLEDMTACLKSAYCVEDTFLELPSSSPSEMLDVFSVSSAWMAARQSNGEFGHLSGDQDECEDLEHD